MLNIIAVVARLEVGILCMHSPETKSSQHFSALTAHKTDNLKLNSESTLEMKKFNLIYFHLFLDLSHLL